VNEGPNSMILCRIRNQACTRAHDELSMPRTAAFMPRSIPDVDESTKQDEHANNRQLITETGQQRTQSAVELYPRDESILRASLPSAEDGKGKCQGIPSSGRLPSAVQRKAAFAQTEEMESSLGRGAKIRSFYFAM
jgi:hypothetical protein